MKIKKLTLISILCLVFHSFVNGQIPDYTELDRGLKVNPDSILQLAIEAEQKADENLKVYYARTRAKSNLQLGQLNQAKSIADSIMKLNPPQDIVLDIMNIRASVLLYTGKTDESIQQFREMQAKSKALKDTTFYQKSTGNLAIVFTMLRKHDSTLKYISQSLELDLKLNDSSSVAYDYNVLGITYLNLEYYSKAIKNLRKALNYNPTGMDLADVYQNIANYHFQQDQPDSAIYYSEKSYKLYEQASSIKGLARATNTLATAYQRKENYSKALEYRKVSLQLAQMQNDSNTISSVYSGFSTIYYRFKNYKESLKYARKAYNLSTQSKNWQFAKNDAAQLVLLFGAINQPDSMEYYQKKQDEFSKKTFQSNYVDQLSEVEGKLNLAEKEREIAQNKLEISTKESEINEYRFQVSILIGSILLVIVGFGTFYMYYRNLQKGKLQAAIITQKEKGYEAVIKATEDERKRISKDLHDGIGQQLSALKLNLNHLQESTDDLNIKNSLQKISQKFSTSADEVRHISHQMMPRSLMENGLVEAIDDLLRNSFELSSVKYTFEHSLKRERYNEKIEISVYRILQELINNCIKHSKASEVQVQLMETKDHLVLLVEDNGVGLQISENDSGHGLLNIKNRIDMVRGKLNLEPSPQSGLLATVSIPINDQA